jgi:hypothetical protein
MRQANQIDIALREEEKRLEREAQLERERWRNLVRYWGVYHRRSWTERKLGFGLNILNIRRSLRLPNDDQESELERITRAYGAIKETDRQTALHIVLLFEKGYTAEEMEKRYKWKKSQYKKRKSEASTRLHTAYLIV